MQEKLISGVTLAQTILTQVAKEVAALGAKRKPALAVILVGNDSASIIYVKNKKAACAAVGITSHEFVLDATSSEQDVINLVEQLNANSAIDGILVQLPLPKHLNSSIVIDHISPDKDVDGFHRYNIGSLAINSPRLCPCTPHGIMYMLDSLKVNYFGQHAVILGTSNIVGRPMALELINRGATVTMCNSKTRNTMQTTSTADILIAATGRAKLVKRDWVKANAIVIDVGMNRDANGQLCGDVDLNDIIDKVAYISPVPGGVGKMTIAMLIRNTLLCYNINLNK
ncbi:MAG: hypothetical protein RL017_200 [Pseudomonadota bacterium]|jgi:methylenetetrahydrofolate dehydrogenase (NADP+)/methenyltetrahydrofolate cyclohydrolase|nr:bifunctional methylenetetrahydrofolate dehydrogenase/methenyltetrahydrofolate cyclohydrolase FolD [Burkholderiales bacterium]